MRKWLCLGIFIFLSFSHCSPEKQGFAFAQVDESAMDLLQKKYYQPRRFNRYNPPVIFGEDKTLWFSFYPSTKAYDRPYAVSLSRKSLGWSEIELKNLILSPETDYIINNYDALPKGHYLLRIALDDEILDSVAFEVINEHEQLEDYIDYDAPLELVEDTEVDDIRLHSR